MVVCALGLGCGPYGLSAPPTPSAPTPDPFAVVRATSEAAYTSGRSHLDRGETIQALIDLDMASTNDPDGRADIQQALGQAIASAQLLTPTVPPTTAPRTIVQATVPAVVAQATALGLTPTPTPEPALASSPPQPTRATSAPQATQAALLSTPGVATPSLVVWHDPQGRFSISAPAEWLTAPQPQALFGNGVVEFRDPAQRVELDVAVDSAARAVSPELYAAGLEIAMQHQVPGYAAEQALPGSTAGQPSVRRVFTFTQQDSAGAQRQARSFQVTVLKGQTPYIISGSAPAEQFQQSNTTFDRMLATFRFS